jgi:hypothetical protein
MASKGAPKAAAAPNSTQLRKAPVSLRSAMRKYAAGGDVGDQGFDDGRDMSRSVMQEAPLQGGNLGAGLAQAVQGIQGGRLQGNDFTQALMDIAKQAQAQNQQDIQQPRFPERVRPPEPRYPDTAPSRPEEVRPPEPRYEEPMRPPEPRYEEPRYPDTAPPRPEIYPQDYAGPRTSNTSQTQQVGPRTSYRQEADGTMTEIGYDGQPVSGYTPEQWAMHNATTGVTPSEYRYVWNGEGYTKVPNGPQIGYDSGVAPTKDPRIDDSRPDPETDPRPEPVYEPMPEPQYYEPELPPEPQYYQPPEIYPQVGPQTGYNEDLTKDFRSSPDEQIRDPRSSPNQQSEGLSALIAKLLAGGGGGGSLEEQRKLMSLLEMLKGK